MIICSRLYSLATVGVVRCQPPVCLRPAEATEAVLDQALCRLEAR